MSRWISASGKALWLSSALQRCSLHVRLAWISLAIWLNAICSNFLRQQNNDIKFRYRSFFLHSCILWISWLRLSERCAVNAKCHTSCIPAKCVSFYDCICHLASLDKDQEIKSNLVIMTQFLFMWLLIYIILLLLRLILLSKIISSQFMFNGCFSVWHCKLTAHSTNRSWLNYCNISG